MNVPRQGGPADEAAGRVNQKRRTRAAIVEAATRLMADGVTPTVAQAAAAAEVSRTTAYRYFPTQDSLLLELAMGADVEAIEAFVATPLAEGETNVDRTLAVVRRFNENVVAAEVQYRSASRVYLDLTLAALAGGDEHPLVREGRRRRWLDTSLGEMPGVTAAARERLVAALCALTGPEGFMALHDIARLPVDEALEVADWAARALVEATLAGPAPSTGHR